MATIRTIETNEAPKPVGPYAQAVVAGDLCFVSGQIGIDPANGTLVDGGIHAEATRVFAHISAILKALGASYDIVQTEIFLIDIDEFSIVNELYTAWLADATILPARKTVAVAALPLGAHIEVACVAQLR